MCQMPANSAQRYGMRRCRPPLLRASVWAKPTETAAERGGAGAEARKVARDIDDSPLTALSWMPTQYRWRTHMPTRIQQSANISFRCFWKCVLRVVVFVLSLFCVVLFKKRLSPKMGTDDPLPSPSDSNNKRGAGGPVRDIQSTSQAPSGTHIRV